MIPIEEFIKGFSETLPAFKNASPWEVTKQLPAIVCEYISKLNNEYDINDGIAIHRSAIIQQGVLLSAPLIIGPHCMIGANACLRAGVFLTGSVTIGTGCEIKTSIIFSQSAIAHFNFIGDSIIGNRVNFEAGSITANCFNERPNKQIDVYYNSAVINTGSEKFGSLVGDDSKIGANAVLSPGTLLVPGSVVKRMELIEQVKQNRAL